VCHHTDSSTGCSNQYYGLGPHHLTPSGILHIAAFVTLSEAYMGIDPTLTYGTTSFTSVSRRART
jgi:hypothetical protein